MYTVQILGVDGVWSEYRVFASRAAAERSVIGLEANGFRARIYRAAFWNGRDPQILKTVTIAGALGK